MSKFLFDVSFDDEVEEPATAVEEDLPPPPPPPPSFSEDELAEARSLAYLAGQEAGELAALERIEAAALDSLGRIEVQIAAAMEAFVARGEDSDRATLRIALAIARKLLPATAERQGLAEMEAVIAAALADARDEPRLVVRVAESLYDTLQARIGAVAQARGYAGKVILLGDDTLLPGDCLVEWADGGTERRMSRIWQALDAQLETLLKAA